MRAPETYYFDHAEGALNPSPPYCSGEAGFVWINEVDEISFDCRFEISSNSLHALQGHGEVNLLNALDLIAGPIGGGRLLWLRVPRKKLRGSFTPQTG